jgi:hypothetical protein
VLYYFEEIPKGDESPLGIVPLESLQVEAKPKGKGR